MQWPNEKDKYRPIKYYTKNKDRITRTSLNTGVKPGAPEGLAVPDPQMIRVVLMLNDTNIICVGHQYV